MSRLFRISTFLLLLLGASSFKIGKQDKGSVVAISAQSSGILSKGFGITITFENIDTEERFKSKPLSHGSRHSIIQNIPPGKYFVQKIEVPVGNLIYGSYSPNVRMFFGQITIEPDSKYYLGDFTGTRQKGKMHSLILSIDNECEIPEKIKEKIEREDTGWIEGDFKKLYPYQTDLLLVY